MITASSLDYRSLPAPFPQRATPNSEIAFGFNTWLGPTGTLWANVLDQSTFTTIGFAEIDDVAGTVTWHPYTGTQGLGENGSGYGQCFCFGADGNIYTFSGDSTSIAVVNPTTGADVAKINPGHPNTATTVYALPGGDGRVYLAYKDGALLGIVAIDTTTHAVAADYRIPGQSASNYPPVFVPPESVGGMLYAFSQDSTRSASGGYGTTFSAINTTTGVVTTYPQDPVGSTVYGSYSVGMAKGSDGRYWVPLGRAIVAFDTTGTKTSYAHTNTTDGTEPVVLGADGNIWELVNSFTGSLRSGVRIISPSGVDTQDVLFSPGILAYGNLTYAPRAHTYYGAGEISSSPAPFFLQKFLVSTAPPPPPPPPPITGTATLTGTPPAAYRLEIRPLATQHGTDLCVEVPIDRTQQFTAHQVGTDGSDVVVAVAWSTTAGTIDANGLLTPDAKIGTYAVSATQI